MGAIPTRKDGEFLYCLDTYVEGDRPMISMQKFPSVMGFFRKQELWPRLPLMQVQGLFGQVFVEQKHMLRRGSIGSCSGFIFCVLVYLHMMRHFNSIIKDQYILVFTQQIFKQFNVLETIKIKLDENRQTSKARRLNVELYLCQPNCLKHVNINDTNNISIPPINLQQNIIFKVVCIYTKIRVREYIIIDSQNPLYKKIMQDNQQITTKRSEFRTQIRRKQIQQHFYQQRLKFAQGQIREEQDQIMKELDTPERKKQWVYKKAAQLGNTPQGNWHQIFRALSIGTRAFSEGDFIDWIQSGITRCLVLVLKQEYLELELSKMSASILQDIFYYLPAQSALIQNLLQHEFILDLVELCANTQSSAQYYYQLIIVMLQNRVYIRNLFIDNGIVQILCTQLKNYLQKNMDIDSDQVYCALSLAYRLVKVYQVKGGKSLPKGNVVSVLIPILDGYLRVIKREESLRVVLKSFASLGMSQKQYIFAYMFESPNLISFLLHAIEKQSSNQNRAIAASTLASILSSQKISYSQQLLRRDILDKVLACSRMENNNRQCIDSLLRIISNISVNSLQDARKVVAHQVFGELIISHANQTQNQKTHQTSTYIICSLLHYENLQLTETLLKKYHILQSLIQGLRAQILSIPNCLEIIRSLIILVRMYNRIYTGSQNKIVLQLERLYNINNVLAIVEEKVRNQRVLGLVRLLFQVMNGEG